MRAGPTKHLWIANIHMNMMISCEKQALIYLNELDTYDDGPSSISMLLLRQLLSWIGNNPNLTVIQALEGDAKCAPGAMLLKAGR